MLETFIISLPKDIDRRESCILHTKKVGLDPICFEATYGKAVIEAINEGDKSLAQKVSFLDKVEIKLPLFRKVIIEDCLSVAELGCALSHLRVYEHMVKNNIECALIMEDDCQLLEPCKFIIPEILKYKKHWDIVQISNNSGIRDLIFRRKIYLDKSKEFYIKREGMGFLDPLFNRRRVALLASAYIINLKGAKRLLEIGYPVRIVADYLLGLIAYNQLRLFTCHPSEKLVNVNSFVSNLENTRPKHKLK